MAGDILKQTAAPGDGRILSASVSARGRAFQVRCFCFPTQSYQTAKSHSRDVGFKSNSSSARLTAGFSSRSRQRKFCLFFVFVTSFESTLILCRLIDSIHILAPSVIS